MKDVTKWVENVLADVLDRAPGGIDPSMRFAEDLHADSLDFLGCIAAIEEHFNVLIPDAAAAEFVTVGDLILWLEAHRC